VSQFRRSKPKVKKCVLVDRGITLSTMEPSDKEPLYPLSEAIAGMLACGKICKNSKA
jgi:hypothetical protein